MSTNSTTWASIPAAAGFQVCKYSDYFVFPKIYGKKIAGSVAAPGNSTLFSKRAAVPAAGGTVASESGLFGEVHLFEEVGSVSDAVDYEKYVTDVERDVAAESRIEGDVAHG